MGGSDRALCAVPAVPADRAARQRGAVQHAPLFANAGRAAGAHLRQLPQDRRSLLPAVVCPHLEARPHHHCHLRASRLSACLLAGAGASAVASRRLFLLIMPLMVSAVIRIFGWTVILGRKGLVNEAFAALGLGPVRLLYTDTAVVIGLVNVFLPFMALPLMAAIERIPPSLEEAAQNLGANWSQMLRRTILPLSLPGLISGSLLVYSISISAFVTPALMGNSRERMAAQQIYDEVLVSFNWPSASSLALTLVLLTLALMFSALYATRGRARLERGG